MARDLQPGDIHYRTIVEIHTMRNPSREPARIQQEVKDFLRRAFRLGPDARTPQEGGLAGLTVSNARDASMLVQRNLTDITKMYRSLHWTGNSSSRIGPITTGW